MTLAPIAPISSPPHPNPLPKGKGSLQPLRQRPFSRPYSLADMTTFYGKLAKASLLGEGQDEGVLKSFRGEFV
jgi:hypothetical protein